jgi:hypothetical protein
MQWNRVSFQILLLDATIRYVRFHYIVKLIQLCLAHCRMQWNSVSFHTLVLDTITISHFIIIIIWCQLLFHTSVLDFIIIWCRLLFYTLLSFDATTISHFVIIRAFALCARYLLSLACNYYHRSLWHAITIIRWHYYHVM